MRVRVRLGVKVRGRARVEVSPCLGPAAHKDAERQGPAEGLGLGSGPGSGLWASGGAWAHEDEERGGEHEEEGGEREPQRDAPDRARVGTQLVEHELATCSRLGGRVGVGGCGRVGQAQGGTQAVRAKPCVAGCDTGARPRRLASHSRLAVLPAASVMHPSAASCTGWSTSCSGLCRLPGMKSWLRRPAAR